MILASVFTVCLMGKPCDDYIVDVAQSTQDCVINTNDKREEFYIAGDDADPIGSLKVLFIDWQLPGINPNEIRSVDFHCGMIPDKDIP